MCQAGDSALLRICFTEGLDGSDLNLERVVACQTIKCLGAGNSYSISSSIGHESKLHFAVYNWCNADPL